MKPEPIEIAIIGMDCIFPGASDNRKYWKNILSCVNSIREFPDYLKCLPYMNPSQDPHNYYYCQRGGFIGEFAKFDPIEFGIMPDSIYGSDPEQFLALQIAARAIADSGYDKKDFDRSRTSVVIGYGKFPTSGFVNAVYHTTTLNDVINNIRQIRPDLSEKDLSELHNKLKANLLPFTAETCSGIIGNVLSGRIANRLNLQGPNFTTDAACASSLVALDIATTQLLLGRVDMVIAGGISANLTPTVYAMFAMLGALSKSGNIKPFDGEADGTLLSEGAGMVILKRLADAKRDNDRIYAVIKGIGSSSDGKGQSLLSPRLEGQVLAISRAYEQSGIDPLQIGLVEAHGTATNVGDATEIAAWQNLFKLSKRQFPTCALGSVKSMIGHTVPAAGMAGLIKTVKALYYKTLPPTLCAKPNQELSIDKTPFYLNTTTSPWISGSNLPRCAGVSSFGFGGINMHVVVEEFTSDSAGFSRCTEAVNGDCELLVLSASSREELLDKCKALLRFSIGNLQVSIGDIAYTLALSTHPDEHWRIAFIATTHSDIASQIEKLLAKINTVDCTTFSDRNGAFFESIPLGLDSGIAMMFPGEGAQYKYMLRDTCMVFPSVRKYFDSLDHLFSVNNYSPLPSQIIYPPSYLQTDYAETVDNLLWKHEYAYGLVLTANISMFSLLNDLGIVPSAVVGHSAGQNCALWAAGALDMDFEKFLSLSLEKQTQVDEKSQPHNIKLLTVGGCDPDDVYQYVNKSNGEILIAMDNCPNQIILCCNNEWSLKVLDYFSSIGAVCSFMPFHRPHHTPLFQKETLKLPTDLKVKKPVFTIYSTTTADCFLSDYDSICYQMIDEWAKPVQFRQTIEKMFNDGIRIFIEAGPRGNLCGFVNDILADQKFIAISPDVTTVSGPLQLLKSLGQLFVNCVPVNLSLLHSNPEKNLLSIDNITKPENVQNKKILQRKNKISMALKMDYPRIHADASFYKQMVPSIKHEATVIQTPPRQSSEDIRRAIWPVPLKLLSNWNCRGAVCKGKNAFTWHKELLSTFFSRNEIEQYKLLNSDEQMTAWLCERLAAKDAVNQLIKRENVSEIEIYTDVNTNKPYIRIADEINNDFLLSFAYSSGLAVSVTMPVKSGVDGFGIAIKPLDNSVFLPSKLSESSLLSDVSKSDQQKWHIRLQAAKEAVARAIGGEISFHNLHCSVSDIDAPHGVVTVNSEYGNNSKQIKPCNVLTGIEGLFVYAIALTAYQG